MFDLQVLTLINVARRGLVKFLFPIAFSHEPAR
ncbi:hypothetical protein EV200_105285 [Pedobacter psychrotolerans]|uniref:Uncharacterized protein n=1 Tax=Pedobacter psychrotolerans TaxID=1843235 RepID=A0A4R2HDI8_9SPHI|nr:hypothetical protein EV200_105285 [Pedobacter psychrotolerans]